MTARLIRFVWGGHIYDADTSGNPVEEWSCSLSTLTEGTAAVGDISDHTHGYFETFHTAEDARISPTCALEWLKVNEFDVSTGHQITDPTNMFEWIPGVRGQGTSTVLLPLQVSPKVSIDNRSRSRRARGGFYVPRFAALTQRDGHYPDTVVSDLLNASAALLDALNGDTVLAGDVGVWSRRGDSFTPSSRVRIGNVPDTQRRRRNELVEVYQELTLT